MSEAVCFETAALFRARLAANAHAATELLVGPHKVDSQLPSVRWSEPVDQAPCYGWIDGVRKRVDDDSCTMRFTPRQPRSIGVCGGTAAGLTKRRASG